MIKIKRKNGTLYAILDGSNKIQQGPFSRTYINNTLNHRIYRKLPDGQNKRVAECSLQEIELKLNETETRTIGVTKFTFKDEEQTIITIPYKDIYHNDLEGRLVPEVDYQIECPDGNSIINKYFNEFIHTIVLQSINLANDELRKERINLTHPVLKIHEYTLEKGEVTTTFTPMGTNSYYNKYQEVAFYNDISSCRLKLDTKEDVYILCKMALTQVIFLKPFEEVKDTNFNEIIFQFRAENGKVLNLQLPEDPKDFQEEITKQINPLYFYYNFNDGISKTVEYLIDFINTVLIDILNNNPVLIEIEPENESEETNPEPTEIEPEETNTEPVETG